MRKRNRASFITATGTALDDVDYGRDVESFLAQRPGWSLASDVDGEEVQRRRAKVAAAIATADAERRAAITKVETLKAARGQASKKIGALKDTAEREQAIAATRGPSLDQTARTCSSPAPKR